MCRARINFTNPLDGGDVFMYRDSSIAPLSEMRRGFKAVLDVLDGIIGTAVSLSRSVELTAQWRGSVFLGLVLCALLLRLTVGGRWWLWGVPWGLSRGSIAGSVVEMRRFVAGEVGYLRIPWFILANG